MLETSGIVRVEPAARYFKLVLLQSDIAEAAIEYLDDEPDVAEPPGAGSLRSQRFYVPPERTRARLAAEPAGASGETQRLVAALRETLQDRRR
jgi:hypothetical protein